MITPLNIKKLSIKKLSGPKKLSLRGAHQKAKKIAGTSYDYYKKKKRRQKLPGTSYSYFKKGPTRRIGKPRAKIKEIRKVGTHMR